MAEKVVYELKVDQELFQKMQKVSEASGQTMNNYLLSLVRTNIAYYERVHGKIK